MISRSARRFSTSAPRTQKWWVAKEMQLPPLPPSERPPHPPPSKAEQMRMTQRRINKAERDERKDITMALTPVKDYMPGFTQPKDIRTANWSKGGRYEELKTYEAPSSSAYEHHTVFLLESRYTVKQGIGRVDCNEHIVGVCRSGDFPAVMKRMSDPFGPNKSIMDNARWPFVKPKVVKQVIWWEGGENPRELHYRGIDQEPQEEMEIETSLDTEGTPTSGGSMKVPTELLPSSSSRPIPKHRGIHTSARALAKFTGLSTSRQERSRIPLSSWSRPPKPSQDAHDDVVPSYYIERKRQRELIAKRKEEEGGLMTELSVGILSDGVAASTRVFPEKIPVEVKELDGTVRHPSGFEPPTPETDFHPIASKSSTVDHPLLTTFKVPWEEVLSPSSTEEDAIAHSLGSSSKGMRGFHTSAPTHATTVDHPSVTPMPSEPPPPVVTPQEHIPSEAEENAPPAFEIDPETGEKLAVYGPPARPRLSPEEFLEDVQRQYRVTLQNETFFRPMLTLTFSTRPLALAISRLSKGLPKGIPYYTALDKMDRKCIASYSSRMRAMRLNRMLNLTLSLATRLKGERGGVLGIRFSPEDRGRGVDGEGFDEPIALENRMIEVGVGEWYMLADEVKEGFLLDAQEAGVEDSIKVIGLDDSGKRLDGSTWPERPEKWRRLSLVNQALTLEEKEQLSIRQKREKLDEFVGDNVEEVARDRAKTHRSVLYP